MKKEKNVEEIYELLRKRNAILKTNFKRMGICGGMIPFTIANSSFGIFSIPFFYYALSIMYSACSYDFLDRYFINSLEYTEFINKFSILFEDLKYMLEGIEIKTPPKIFASYYYLVRNGFLSQDHTFMANNIPNYKFNNASSIPAGYGVCRNLAPFLTQLLQSFSYKSYTIQMLLEEQMLCKMTEEQFLHDKDEVFFEGNYGEYNHVTTLFADKNRSYIMDPMNETFYLIYEDFVYPFRNDKEAVYTGLKTEDTYYKHRKIPKVDSSGIEDFEEIVIEYLQAKENCSDCIPTFEKFYVEHRDLYKELAFDSSQLSKGYEKILSLYK